MELIQLRYFKEVANLESFTRAAETLHITQSALSKSIGKLEDEVGIQLFERVGNRIALNQFGQRFLEDSEQTLTRLSDSIRAVRELAGLERGEVRISISKDVFVDHLIRDFLINYPDVAFHCYLLSPEQMRLALDQGAIDLAITAEPVIGKDILWQPMYHDQLEVMLSSSHPLAGARKLHLEQLRGERFVITNSNYDMKNMIRKLCSFAGFEPKILYEGTSTDMPMHFVANGDAIMITPHSITEGVSKLISIKPDVIAIPLANDYPGMQKDMGVSFKEGHYQSLATHAFYDRMLEFYSSIS